MRLPPPAGEGPGVGVPDASSGDERLGCGGLLALTPGPLAHLTAGAGEPRDGGRGIRGAERSSALLPRQWAQGWR